MTSMTPAKRGSFLSSYGIFLIPGILLFVVLIIGPLIANIAISFTRWTGVGIPRFVGFANYQKAFGDTIFWTAFKNNILIIVGLTTIPTLIGLALSFALFDFVARRYGQWVVSIFRAGFYLPQIIPVVVAGMVWQWLLQPNWGVVNQLLVSVGLPPRNWLGDPSTAMLAVMVALIWFQIGYPLVIFMSGLQRIDPELYEAASIDGATGMQRLAYITVPLLRPELYVVILTTTIYALKTFGPIFAMTGGGPGTSTMVASYMSYKNFFENSNVGYGATISTLLTVVIALITVVYVHVQSQQERQEAL